MFRRYARAPTFIRLVLWRLHLQVWVRTASLLALARSPQLSSAFYFKTSSNLQMHIPLPSSLAASTAAP
ncbi:hypothetical protein ACQKWADRAFT_277834 [Trichoderma austrokoningii]